MKKSTENTQNFSEEIDYAFLVDALKTLARNVRELRKRAELSQTALSERCVQTSQQAISTIEQASHQPQLDTIADIARALRVDAWRLLAPPDLSQLVDLYLAADPDNRALLLRIAESLAQSARGGLG